MGRHRRSRRTAAAAALLRDAIATTATSNTTDSTPVDHLHLLYGNCRGFKQAHSQVAAQARQRRPALILLNETHLSDADSIQSLIPPGYKCVVRLDRNRHGGGLLVLAEDFRLVDSLDVTTLNTVNMTEFVCVDYMGIRTLLCYTQKSTAASVLFDALGQLRINSPDKQMLFVGDFNAHHSDWLASSTTDEAGVRARAFSEMFSMPQLVDVPTRGDNILDLVYADTGGEVEVCSHFGTSDHLSLSLMIPTTLHNPEPLARRPMHQWFRANHFY